MALSTNSFPSLGLALHGDKDGARFTRRESYSTPSDTGVAALGEDFGALQDLLEGHWDDSSAAIFTSCRFGGAVGLRLDQVALCFFSPLRPRSY